MATAAHGLDAAAAQAELGAGLRLRRNADRHFAFQRRHRQFGAQRRLRKADRQFAVQVVAVALEDRMLAHVHFHIQIASRRSGRARLALPGQADAVTVVDAFGDLHGQRAGFFEATLAMAFPARLLDRLAAAAAVRAGLLDREDAVLHAHLTVAVAGLALADLAVLRTAAIAMVAVDLGRHLDLPADAEHGLLQVQLHDVAQVGSAPRTATPAATAAENVAEDVAENVADIAETGAAATAHAVLEGGMAVLVVHRALRGIGQYLVGLLGLLELVLRHRIVRAAVRMIFHRQPAEGFLQFGFADAALDAQHLVVVTLAHSCIHTACRCPVRRSRRFRIPFNRQPAPGFPARAGSSAVPTTVANYFLSSFTSVNSASTTSSGWAEPPGADCVPASAGPPPCAAA